MSSEELARAERACSGSAYQLSVESAVPDALLPDVMLLEAVAPVCCGQSAYTARIVRQVWIRLGQSGWAGSYTGWRTSRRGG